MIFLDFFKALAQFGDVRFRRVLWRGIGLTIALLVGAYAVFLYIISLSGAEQWIVETIGGVTWVGSFLTFGSLILMVILSIFLMVPVASIITSMFLDEVADAVEDRHYPNLPATPNVSFMDGLIESLNFLGLMIVANIAALILWAFIPILAPFIFWGLNGYLLGREYFQLAAKRHLGRAGAKRLYKQYRWKVWSAGILMAVPLTIPLLNLLIPVLGAATFTHQFHRLNASRF